MKEHESQPAATEGNTWTLHPKLAADCHDLGWLGDSCLLLHRDASLHWFILVPRTSALDVVDLEQPQCQMLMTHAAAVGGFLKATLRYPRVNIAALGLLVPQLHLHVIGRRENDPCWPGPVWGALPPGPAYSQKDLDDLLASLNLDLR